MHGSFAITPQMAKVISQCLVQMEKALRYCVCVRGHIHIFIMLYCYNCLMLSLVVNPVLCLIYKLSFITDI